MTKKPQTTKPKTNSFVEAARELGLDTDEAEVAFERAFGKIAPPKNRPAKAENAGDDAKETPSKD